MNKPKMIMMCGLVGSGKSTYAEELAERYNANIHASDKIREELGDINDQSHNNKVFEILHNRIKKDLYYGKNCIMDATNINYKKRMAFLQELNKIPCEKICVFMATPYEECLKNNTKRERKVPQYVIERMYRHFECPHYFEGWNKIEIIYNNSNIKPKFNRSSLEFMFIDKMKNFNQNNPHHLYDVYDHSKALAFQYKTTDIQRISALLHDCMKKATEVIDDNNISHYYHHANISAYYVLTHPNIVNCNTFDEMIEIIFYITYHMIAHDIKEIKTINKYKNIFGEQLFNSLMEFAQKDKIASNVAIFNHNKQNIYITNNNYTIGYTRLGDVFYIDNDDLQKALSYTWCVKNKKSNDYRLVSLTDGKMKFLHRIIMNVDNSKLLVDHINHNQYDNRKNNLRLCNIKENCRNTSLSKNNTTGVNGVSQMKNGKYRAYINVDKKQIYLGVFNTITEAKKARDDASVKYYGEFANLNI